MISKKSNNNYDSLKDEGTGAVNNFEKHKIAIYPFDKYEIKVKLTEDNKFLGITEIKINKEFLSHKQKIISTGFHDVEEFYTE